MQNAERSSFSILRSAFPNFFGSLSWELFINHIFRGSCRGNFIDGCLQANGLLHTSPGQRPGCACDLFWPQANGLAHPPMSRAFSAGKGLLARTAFSAVHSVVSWLIICAAMCPNRSIYRGFVVPAQNLGVFRGLPSFVFGTALR